MEISKIVLLVVLAVAVYTDIRIGKIKNWLTLPAIVIGPILHFVQAGRVSALSSVEAIGVMILVCIVLVLFRAIGGGDIKLLVAVGSLAGMSLVWTTLLYTALAGGVLALVYLVIRRRAVDVTKQVATEAMTSVLLKAKPVIGCNSGIKVPYSIAIAAGTLAALLLTA